MIEPNFGDTFELLENYVARRPRRGPFPLESAFTWTALLKTQSANKISGEMLEIGVEFGTSAFLLMDALGVDEHLTLVDLVRTLEWDEACRGTYGTQTNFTFIEASSNSLSPRNLPKNCRWIHVDGGHLYDHVRNDLELTANLLATNGILVVDDFFEIRWPDVTSAFMDYLKTDTGLMPFLLVNRKLYCTRSAETAKAYQAVFHSFITHNAAQIGTVKVWSGVEMIGHSLLVAKMTLAQRFQALEQSEIVT